MIITQDNMGVEGYDNNEDWAINYSWYVSKLKFELRFF